MKNYMYVQKKKIEIEKWCEGCRLNHDPGDTYVMEWILNNGAWFREAWEKSLCNKCLFDQQCGYEVREECVRFKFANGN